nr:hypothetical protein [Mucilaginibacter sp. FT3.2]
MALNHSAKQLLIYVVYIKVNGKPTPFVFIWYNTQKSLLIINLLLPPASKLYIELNSGAAISALK